MLDASQGPLRLLGVLERLHNTPIPLGTKGTLRGIEYLIVGYMSRSCQVEGTKYSWDELLLYDPKATSFSWLLRSDGHWQLATPLGAAEVTASRHARYQNRTFRGYSRVVGRVDSVLGEFYWAVAVGDKAELDDFIAPPEGLSSRVDRPRGELEPSDAPRSERGRGGVPRARCGTGHGFRRRSNPALP